MPFFAWWRLSGFLGHLSTQASDCALQDTARRATLAEDDTCLLGLYFDAAMGQSHLKCLTCAGVVSNHPTLILSKKLAIEHI